MDDSFNSPCGRHIGIRIKANNGEMCNAMRMSEVWVKEPSMDVSAGFLSAFFGDEFRDVCGNNELPEQQSYTHDTTWLRHHYWTSCPRCPTPKDGDPQFPARPCSTACRSRLTRKPTSWVAWPTGLRVKTASGEDASSTATATTGVYI
jgi:hypothetical protein